METILKGFLCLRLIEFKSYYVVWKRSKSTLYRNRNLKFKSYYVVWKLYYIFD